jgi:hypothetical protein
MNDTEDYLAAKANEEGTVDQFPIMPEGVDEEEEAMRLAMKASQDQLLPQALPHYAVVFMLLGLSEEEALRLAMDTACAPPTPSPWE